MAVIDARLLRAGWRLVTRFGLRHACRRFSEYLTARKLDRFKDRAYRRLRPGGLVRRTILGHQMELDTADHGIHRDLFLDCIREPAATSHTMATLGPDDVALEIGANIGYYALIASRICRKVYAVEPQPRQLRTPCGQPGAQ